MIHFGSMDELQGGLIIKTGYTVSEWILEKRVPSMDTNQPGAQPSERFPFE